MSPSSLSDNITASSGSDSQEMDASEARHAFGREERKDLADVGSADSSNLLDQDTGHKLSTNAIIRLAGQRFVQSCSQRVDLSVLSHPFTSSYVGLNADDSRDVDLVGCLLAAAEKVDQKQFAQASLRLSEYCDFCSNKGSPVQRLVYYFSQALQELINQDAGRTRSLCVGKESLDLDETLKSAKLANLAFHQKIPFTQVCQQSGMQAIIENVAGSKKVHLIDLAIINGCSHVILMQALAARRECPLEHLRITAVGTKLKQNLEDAGKQLVDFADSISLSFSFKVVMVADMLDLNESLFELDSEEALAVCSSYLFSTMIKRPDQLEWVMGVIRNMDPCILVFNCIEGNLNSPVFVNRFVEALFFEGAFFDSLEDCMDRGDPNRMFLESRYFHEGIRSFMGVDGKERCNRHVNLKVWRKFFSRFGMVQIELSTSALEQAHLSVKRIACWSSCTIGIDEKGLIIGWKGTPLFSFSLWKFV